MSLYVVFLSSKLVRVILVVITDGSRAGAEAMTGYLRLRLQMSRHDIYHVLLDRDSGKFSPDSKSRFHFLMEGAVASHRERIQKGMENLSRFCKLFSTGGEM